MRWRPHAPHRVSNGCLLESGGLGSSVYVVSGALGRRCCRVKDRLGPGVLHASQTGCQEGRGPACSPVPSVASLGFLVRRPLRLWLGGAPRSRPARARAPAASPKAGLIEAFRGAGWPGPKRGGTGQDRKSQPQGIIIIVSRGCSLLLWFEEEIYFLCIVDPLLFECSPRNHGFERLFESSTQQRDVESGGEHDVFKC